ncbi:MAG: O-acetyl-ADP-ribose deacetylase [Flavobacterium sp.]|nr:MAG: O-acetyl-ADP-ribose deacetylase [Flavobacterium sp.]
MNIEIILGDITQIEADVIVNAANTSLLGGGGVDGAIHKAGGPEILAECKAIRNRQGGCKVGEAVITTAGNLNARKVIHTVGPKWNNGNSNEAELLRKCYLNCLKLAESGNYTSIAFPNISTGIYGYPKEPAAQITFETITGFKANGLETIFLVCFDEENYRLCKNYFSLQ